MRADHGHDIVQHHQLHAGHGLSLLSSTWATLPPTTGEAARAAIFSPSMRTSMPYCALPLTLSGVSRRFTGLPISLRSLSALSLTSCGAGSLAARRRERAIGQFAAAMGVVDHLTAFGAQGGGIDFPLLGGRLHHHGAARGAHLAQRRIEAADRGRTAGGHAMRARAAIERVDRRRRQRRHIGEIHIQFIGQKLGQRGVDALAHFLLRESGRRLCRPARWR